MAVIRLLLLIMVFGGLALLLVQNWSPALPIVFLGIKTTAQPLALWILFSVSAGVCSSLLISSLFQLSTYFSVGQQPRRRQPQVSPPRYTSSRSRREEEPAYRSSTPPPTADSTPQPQPSTSASETPEPEDDWDFNKNNDDWDFQEPQAKPVDKTPNPPSSQEPLQDARSYERTQAPKNTYKSGSVYSYSYKQPKNTGAGKTESIYDADYRVIVPPYKPPSTNQPTPKTNQPNHNDDDWGFLDDEDDDFFEEDERPRK